MEKSWISKLSAKTLKTNLLRSLAHCCRDSTYVRFIFISHNSTPIKSSENTHNRLLIHLEAHNFRENLQPRYLTQSDLETVILNNRKIMNTWSEYNGPFGIVSKASSRYNFNAKLHNYFDISPDLMDNYWHKHLSHFDWCRSGNSHKLLSKYENDRKNLHKSMINKKNCAVDNCCLNNRSVWIWNRLSGAIFALKRC